MKVRNSLKSLRGRHRDNKIVRRKGRVYIINKTNARYKARQGAEPGQWIEPPKKLPHVQHGNPTHNLDFLFGALKVAPDDITAKAVEERIWALWTASRSDTITLCMSRVQAATEAKDIDLAITLLDAVIKIKPKYVEAWNRRATIY